MGWEGFRVKAVWKQSVLRSRLMACRVRVITGMFGSYQACQTVFPRFLYGSLWARFMVCVWKCSHAPWLPWPEEKWKVDYYYRIQLLSRNENEVRWDTGRNSEVCARVCWSPFQPLGFSKEEQLLLSNNQIVQSRTFQSVSSTTCARQRPQEVGEGRQREGAG